MLLLSSVKKLSLVVEGPVLPLKSKGKNGKSRGSVGTSSSPNGFPNPARIASKPIQRVNSSSVKSSGEKSLPVPTAGTAVISGSCGGVGSKESVDPEDDGEGIERPHDQAMLRRTSLGA